jgi:hypothetical protein
MRNLSKNTLKRLMRPFNGGAAGWAHRFSDYHFFNQCGTRAWVQSKGRINNRDGAGAEKYLTRPQQKAWAAYWQ